MASNRENARQWEADGVDFQAFRMDRAEVARLAVCAFSAALHEDVDALCGARTALAGGEAKALAVCIARA